MSLAEHPFPPPEKATRLRPLVRRFCQDNSRQFASSRAPSRRTDRVVQRSLIVCVLGVVLTGSATLGMQMVALERRDLSPLK